MDFLSEVIKTPWISYCFASNKPNDPLSSKWTKCMKLRLRSLSAERSSSLTTDWGFSVGAGTWQCCSTYIDSYWFHCCTSVFLCAPSREFSFDIHIYIHYIIIYICLFNFIYLFIHYFILSIYIFTGLIYPYLSLAFPLNFHLHGRSLRWSHPPQCHSSRPGCHDDAPWISQVSGNNSCH